MEGIHFVWDESDEDSLFSIPGEGGEDGGVEDGELAVDLKPRMYWHPHRTVCQRKWNVLCIYIPDSRRSQHPITLPEIHSWIDAPAGRTSYSAPSVERVHPISVISACDIRLKVGAGVNK
jgi:hypothetical protein